MNNNEVKNVENKQNGSLMRKTKAQLVEIILRKDSIENNLRTNIKGKEKELENKRRDLNIINNNYVSLQNEYHSVCDDKASLECELNTTIKKQKVFIRLLVIILCISVAFNYIFYVI